MRRTSTAKDRPFRAYDPLQEVEPKRLQTIGAITIAWNWIEGAIDASLSVALQLHPVMWNEVTTRINGLDSKFALLKKLATLHLGGIDEFFDEARFRIADTIGQVTAAKSLRDGVIHVRLLEPEAVSGDIPVGKGKLHEILVSEEALDGLYMLLLHLGREIDEVSTLFYTNWLVVNAERAERRHTCAVEFGASLARLTDLQKKRAAFPPLPQFPDEPPEPEGSEAAQGPPD